MSTVTTFLNLVKAAALEQFSLATLNNNLDLVDAGVKKATPEFVAVNTSDTNWSYNGGLHIQNTTNKAAHLLLQIGRIAGGSVAITTTPLQFMVPIPVGYRPTYSVSRYGVLQNTSTGADIWGLKMKIDNQGRLFISTDTGSSSVAVGHTIELDMWWSL